MKSQHQAVVDAVMSIKACHTSNLTKEERREVSEIVACEIGDGKVAFSIDAQAKYNTPQLIYSYAARLVNNWLTKSPILNNGQKYTPKGTGKGRITDPLLKNLIDLKVANSANADASEAIELEIMKRKMELQNAKKPQIDVNVLPEHLRHLA